MRPIYIALTIIGLLLAALLVIALLALPKKADARQRVSSGVVGVTCAEVVGPNLISTLLPSSTLISAWGTWGFGPEATAATGAGPPGPFGEYYGVTLNGKIPQQSNASSAISRCSNGQIVFLTGQNDRLWYQWGGWQGRAPFVGSPDIIPSSLSSFPLPVYSPPYTPSTDGTSIACGGVGTLTTVDGTWTCPGSGASPALLLGIPNLNGYDIGPVTQMEVATGGTMWAKASSGGYWYAFLDYFWYPQIGSTVLTSIPAGPIPVEVNLNHGLICSVPLPSVDGCLAPNITTTTPATGTVMATITIKMSDGTSGGIGVCAGCTLSLDIAEGSDLVISGSNLVLNSHPVVSSNAYRVRVTQGNFFTFAGASGVRLYVTM